jgi:hypothetical protein
LPASDNSEDDPGLLDRCKRPPRIGGNIGDGSDPLGIIPRHGPIGVPQRILEPHADVAAMRNGGRQGGGFAAPKGADRPNGAEPMPLQAGKEGIEILGPAFLVARIAAEHEKQARLSDISKATPAMEPCEYVEIGIVVEDVLNADALLGGPGEEGGRFRFPSAQDFA